ncbi:MAG: DUF4397 domain-containing protein [Gammaproteobacteria bacterium]|jgi:hypothetical protein|nr:DUF4397 domain-containing protein [Gammaproteobacteria bacterium]
MARISRVLAAIIVAFAIGACGSDSSLPVATGKASIRMINAIPTSPEIGFLIEERALDAVRYKSNSSPESWDDLEYTFNFEINRPFENELTRIASQFLDVTREIEYTFLVRGSLDAAVVDVWQIPERSFSGSETIFEMRVGNAADALGLVDVYVGLEGVDPVLGAQVASLAPGEVSAPTDIEEDVYVVTITAAGDPANILFQSVPTRILANQSVIVTAFAGDANDTAPVTVRLFNQLGASSAVTDARFPPTARLIHATSDLGTSDVYDDAALQNRIVADLAFGDITGDIDVAVGEVPITATAPGNVGAILLEDTLTTFAGSRLNYYLTVLSDEVVGSQVFVDRRPVETIARLTFFHSAINHEFVDLYVVDAGTTIDDVFPRLITATYGLQASEIRLDAGSYEIYVTTAGEKTILDGPVSLEVALGDVFEAVLLDRVDPSLAEFKLFPPL